MPFLRGSKPTKNVQVISAAPSLNSKIRRLERKVAGQTPETRYYQHTDSINSKATAGTFTSDVSVTETLIGSSPFFRDNISGDRWQNLNLELKFATETVATERVRVIVYMPMSATATASTATGFPTDFCSMQDPSKIRILYDRVWDSTGFDTTLCKTVYANINRETLYNSTGTSVEKGNLRVRITAETNAGGINPAIRYSWKLAFHDK